MAITLRTVTGSALSHVQIDTNFSSLLYSGSISGNTLTLHYSSSAFSPSNLTIPLISASFALTASTATNARVATSNGNFNFKVPFTETTASATGNYGMLQDSETVFTYNPSTNILSAPVINATTACRGGNGSAASPAFSFSGDNDNGMYYAGTNSIGFSTAGAARVAIDNGGSVGVGTTTPDPSALLDLDSRVRGFLPPRVNNTEMNSIASPAEGLMVYNTEDPGVFVYISGNWEKLRIVS
jgi:hypothetical protein